MWVVTPSPLPPHPLIQIRLEISSSYPFPLFLWKFKLTPSGFHLLRVNTSDRIYKVVRMHNDLVRQHIWQLLQSAISTPIVAVHFRAWSNTSLYYR